MLKEDIISSLYVHVPFCVKKCAYCAFYSQPAGEALVDRYVSALVHELERVSGNLRPRTIFFGGGTPSLMTFKQWERILKAMERLNLLGAEEWTVESNPATVSMEKAKLLRSYGVNRISMGVQSLDPAVLKTLGRIHSRQEVFKSFDILRQAGFDNIGLDLMFAVPGQSMASFCSTLDEAMAMGEEHLSCYELIYEEDTVFFEQLTAGRYTEDEDLECAMYDELLARSERAGFVQYEISNFARRTAGDPGDVPVRACQHNVNYWRGGSYYGLGPSASGYVKGVRTRNYSNTEKYCRLVEEGKSAVEFSEKLSPLARAGELAAFGLRMNSGWPLKLFRERTGFDLQVEWAAEIKKLTGMGYARLDRNGFRLTQSGLRFADWAAELVLRS